MADSTDISRGSFQADPFVERVRNSQADTVYVPVEEMPGFDPDTYDVNREHERLSAQDHSSLHQNGMHAVFDVVRHAWAFKRGVPEESARAAAGEDIHAGASSSFGDLPGATDIAPPGAPVQDVVVEPGEPTPIIGAAQAANPPEVVTETTRTNPVQPTPVGVSTMPAAERLNMPAETGDDGHPNEGRAPEEAPGDRLNNPEPSEQPDAEDRPEGNVAPGTPEFQQNASGPQQPTSDPNLGGVH